MRRLNPHRSLIWTFLAKAMVLVPGLSACSSTQEPAASGATSEVIVGGFRVALESSPLRLTVKATDGRLLFDGLAPGAVKASPDGEEDPPPKVGLAVREVKTSQKMLYGSFLLKDTPSTWRVATKAIAVSTEGGRLKFSAVDAAGEVARVTVASEATGELGISIEANSPSSSKEVAGARTWVSLGSRCATAEKFLGFGAQARDVEHRGTVVPLFITEPGVGKQENDIPSPIFFIAGTRRASSFPAPIFLSSAGYVGALDGFGRATFGMCHEVAGIDDPSPLPDRVTTGDVLRVAQDVTTSSGKFVYRLFDGPTAKEALGRSTARYGRPRLPPRLAFAPWNDAIFGSDSVRATAKTLRDKDIPSSAIWTEDFRGGEFKGDDYKLSENWKVDRTLYPGYEALIDELHGQGLAFFAYFNTFVEVDNDVYAEAKSKHLIRGLDGTDLIFESVKQKKTGMVDLTSAAARAWNTEQLVNALNQGVDGWMGDYGEWAPLNSSPQDGSDPWDAHQRYPLAWQKVQRDALDRDLAGKAPPKSRRVAFVRSGWLGSAPFADVVWAGDQRTNMAPDDGLPTVIPMGLGLGIAGISTYGSDLGGYQSATNETTSKETFFRWTTLSAFSPVMRTHHGTAPKKNTLFNTDDSTLAHYRRYAILHQQLLPVWEALAKEAHETGLPIWRHLALEFPTDVDAWKVDDAFLIGSSILVAPIQTPGVTSRSVYLPAGRWIPFFGGPAKVGPARIDAKADLPEIPVFIREGATIVMLPDRVRSVFDESASVTRVKDVADDRVVIVALGASSSFAEVGGLTYNVTSVKGDTIGTAAPTWNGTPLSACKEPAKKECFVRTEARLVAYVQGGGKLTVGKSTIEAKAGAATRNLELDIRE